MINNNPKHKWLHKMKDTDPKLLELYHDVLKYQLLFKHYDSRVSVAYAVYCNAQIPSVKDEEVLPWDQ